eukprot:SAG11_NODE_5060_length_1676_cov_2.060875_1_plen_31_part_10
MLVLLNLVRVERSAVLTIVQPQCFQKQYHGG